MTGEIKAQLAALKDLVGRRRYRIAMLRYGHGLSHREISRKLKISRQMVGKDLAAMRRDFGRLREVKQRHRMVSLDDLESLPAPLPSLN